jgi:hypothetical protein
MAYPTVMGDLGPRTVGSESRTRSEPADGASASTSALSGMEVAIDMSRVSFLFERRREIFKKYEIELHSA